jgi:hypothetical protein
MSKTKIKIRYFLIFLTAAMSLLFNQRYSLGQKDTVSDNQNIIIKPDISYSAVNLPDPFKSLIQLEKPDTTEKNAPADVVELPELKVQGIFWGADFPQAIINNKVVKAGDIVSKAQIISIEKDAITVFFANRQFKLSSPASKNLEDSSKNSGKKEGINEK